MSFSPTHYGFERRAAATGGESRYALVVWGWLTSVKRGDWGLVSHLRTGNVCDNLGYRGAPMRRTRIMLV